MKICFLGNANSVHLEKWCKWFSEYGHEVSVISLVKGSIEGAEVFHVEKNVHKGWLSRKLEVFSLARAFSEREISEISCCLESVRPLPLISCI